MKEGMYSLRSLFLPEVSVGFLGAMVVVVLGLCVLSGRYGYIQHLHNVLGKRAGQASEPVKILHIQHSTTHYTSNIEDIETKQIALSFTYPNSMFARTTLATSK